MSGRRLIHPFVLFLNVLNPVKYNGNIPLIPAFSQYCNQILAQFLITGVFITGILELPYLIFYILYYELKSHCSQPAF